MDKFTLTQKCQALTEQASERYGAGFPKQGQARLESLLNLLLEELASGPPNPPTPKNSERR